MKSGGSGGYTRQGNPNTTGSFLSNQTLEEFYVVQIFATTTLLHDVCFGGKLARTGRVQFARTCTTEGSKKSSAKPSCAKIDVPHRSQFSRVIMTNT